jgi:uncharacterized protein
MRVARSNAWYGGKHPAGDVRCAMHSKALFTALLFLCMASAQAQPSPAKKPLVERILKTQQVVIEGMAKQMAEQPALAVLNRAGELLNQKIAPEKRDAVAKDIQGDVKKYLDEAVPLVRDRAVKLAPQTVGVLLDEKFSEDELKQLANFLESPVYNKYQQMGGDMYKTLAEKLFAETRVAIAPKVNALDQSVAKRLGMLPPPAAATPAKPASSTK